MEKSHLYLQTDALLGGPVLILALDFVCSATQPMSTCINPVL